MKRWLILVIFSFPFLVIGQNLVPNPSFEDINDTISRFIDGSEEYRSKIESWVTPNTATPDIITPDFDERYINPPAPRTGNNIVGIQFCKSYIGNYWSETIGVELIDSLKSKRTYYVEYYIRRAECINPSENIDEPMTHNFGVLFTSRAMNYDNPDIITATLHIHGDETKVISTNEWTKISGYFTPTQNYKFLYLGQFRENEEVDLEYMNSYYVIDDVSVTAVHDISTIDESVALPVGSIIPLRNVNFISGSTMLSDEESNRVLNDLAKFLNKNTSIRIRINGHTDSIGNDADNLNLSEKRAESIASVLYAIGISQDRVQWKGFGELYPIADNHSKDGRLQNRRVEFEVIE